MKKINKVLIAGMLVTGTSTTGMIINNHVNNQETEVNSFQTKITTSADLAPAETHGTVTFGTVSSITDSSTDDVLIASASYIEGPTPEPNLTDNMAIVIYPQLTTDFSAAPLGVVSTTATELQGPATELKISTSSLVVGTTYVVYAARENITTNKYDVLADTPANFIYEDKLGGEVSSVTGAPTPETSFGANDGTITATVNIDPKAATSIDKVQVSIDGGTKWEEAIVTGNTATHTFSSLEPNTYNINAKVTSTTAIGSDLESNVVNSVNVIVIPAPQVDATIGAPVAKANDPLTYGGLGSIDVTATIETNDTTVSNIQYSLDNKASWHNVTDPTNPNISFNIPDVSVGSYTVYIQATTGMSNVIESPASNSVEVIEAPQEDAKITNLIGTSQDVIDFGNENGSINMTATIEPNNSIINSVKVTKDDGITWVDATSGISETVNHNFTGLIAGTYNINVKVTTGSGEILGTAVPVTVHNKIDTIPTLGDPATNTKPTSNEDGSVTHEKGSLGIELTIGGATSLPAGTTGQYQVSNGSRTTQSVAATYDVETKSFTLSADLVIDQAIAEAGYSIVLTDVVYKGKTLHPIDIATYEAIEAGLGAGLIAGIIMASLFGVGLVGSGCYYAYSKKNEINEVQKNKKSQAKLKSLPKAK